MIEVKHLAQGHKASEQWILDMNLDSVPLELYTDSIIFTPTFLAASLQQ